MEIDGKDREILAALDLDGRTGANEMGKKTGIPKQVVRYRIKRMMKNGIIEGFYATVDYRKLGFSIYNVLLKTSPSSEEKERQFSDFLSGQKNAVYVIKLMGTWDYYVAVAVKNGSELNTFLENLKKRYAKSIIDYGILNAITDYAFPIKYVYPGKFSHLLFADVMGENGRGSAPELDGKSLDVLKVLAANPLASAKEVMLGTKLSFGKIRSVTERIFSSGVITRIRPTINLKKMGYLRFLVFMKFRPDSEKICGDFISMAKSNSSIVFINRCIGQYDMIVDLNVKDTDALRKALFDIYGVLGDFLSKADVIPVYEEIKTAAASTEGKPKEFPFD